VCIKNGHIHKVAEEIGHNKVFQPTFDRALPSLPLRSVAVKRS